MSEFAVVISILTVLVLAMFHFRWAAVDPHSPKQNALPGASRSSIMVTALWATALWPSGSFADEVILGELPVRQAAADLAVGLMFGPAIVSPSRLSPVEEPSAIRRTLHWAKMSTSGALLKLIAAGTIAWALTILGAPSPQIFALLALYVILEPGRSIALHLAVQQVTPPELSERLERYYIGIQWPGRLALLAWTALAITQFGDKLLVGPGIGALIAGVAAFALIENCSRR